MLTRVLLAAAAAAAAAGPAWAQRAPQCERCHASAEFLRQAAPLARAPDSLVVTRALLAGGPHGAVACASCHPGAGSFPHGPAARAAAGCTACHAAQEAAWQGGVHAPHAGGAAGATCGSCHGGHRMARAEALRTAAGRTGTRATCARCHAQEGRTAARDVHADSIACASCHGAHAVRPVRDPATRGIDIALARACSACHVAVAATYWRDVHGRTAARQAGAPEPLVGDPAATCVSCHGEHGILRADDPSWRFAVADACARCHGAYGRTFRDSYHGQASRVGSLRAAQCADCHTAHAVYRTADAASSVSHGRRLATCRGCHAGASAGFTGYRPHANPRSREQNPAVFYAWLFMNSVLFGTMIVWGAHTLLWYGRTMIERRRRPAGRGPAGPVPLDAAMRGEGPYVWRFGVLFRLIHAMIVITFFLLVITGLPLRFSCALWAPGLMRLLGGATNAGLVHRVAGIFVFGYFGLYAAYVAFRLWTTSNRSGLLLGSGSILFRRQDARDVVQMVKWFFGRAPRPKFGRYSYMEKFDYFAELWGVGIIGFTGLMLWQPEFFARFFPGILFNIAIIVHSYEAMIATAFIFLIHFFNVHLRPDKWPLDAVMFTGRATLQYMEEEHPLIAEELRAKVMGREPSRRAITDQPAAAPPPWMSRFAAVSGLLLLGIGLGLIGLILWGSLC